MLEPDLILVNGRVTKQDLVEPEAQSPAIQDATPFAAGRRVEIYTLGVWPGQALSPWPLYEGEDVRRPRSTIESLADMPRP